MPYKFRIADSGSSNVNYYNIYLDDYNNKLASNVLLPYDVVVNDWKPSFLFIVENNMFTCGAVKNILINNLTTTTSTQPVLTLTTNSYTPPSTSTTTLPATTTNPPTTTQTTPSPSTTTSTSSTTSSTTQAPNVNVYLTAHFDDDAGLIVIDAYLRNNNGTPYISLIDFYIEGTLYYRNSIGGFTSSTPFSLYIPIGYSTNHTVFAIANVESLEYACISSVTPSSSGGTTFTIISSC